MAQQESFKHAIQRVLKHSRLLLCHWLACWSMLAIAFAPAHAANMPTNINAAELVHELANLLAAGRNDTFNHLSRLGFSEQVDELRRPGVSTADNFSAQTVIESLYRRAEQTNPGDGARFLAVLFQDAAASSAAIASDPAFASLRELARTNPRLREPPIRFARIDASGPADAIAPLPETLEAAAQKLSDFYGSRGIAQARATLLRNLNKSSFDRAVFDQILMRATSPEHALRAMLIAGTPPPRAEIALRNLMREAMASSAALYFDAEAMSLIEKLSSELPPEYQRYAAQENDIASRRDQAAAARGTQQPGTEHKANDADVIATLKRKPDDPSGGRPSPWQPNPPDDGGSGGSSGSGGPPTPMSKHTKAYERYIDATFERPGPSLSGSNGQPMTPRSFNTARFSARAGRGVSVGGKVRLAGIDSPVRAMWVSQRDDSRFGRLYVSLKTAGASKPVLAASRVMFTDSFRSALAVLWGKWSDTSQYREEDILVLMSMDPDHPLSIKSANRGRKHLLDAAIQKLTPDELRRLKQLLVTKQTGSVDRRIGPDTPPSAEEGESEMDALLKEALPRLSPFDRAYAESLASERGIVIHPALLGRELGWSAARVDFWFNQLDKLVDEVKQQNPGVTIEDPLDTLPSEMSTWQFYERAAVISIDTRAGTVPELMVKSGASSGSRFDESMSRRSHFAVSIFSNEGVPSSIQAEDGFYRRPDMEAQVQPLLDWLATRHHDFMRLNDFSEAFSLLRWLKRGNVAPAIVDMAGDGRGIATPDRVNIGKGPSVGQSH